MAAAPKTAMVLAAGLGTRMRPLTIHRPKALVEVGGKPLIDHALDRLRDAGVERAVVNVHYLADSLEAYLGARARPAIAISDERARLLETGGGLKKARPLLGDEPIFAANIDSVWIENRPALDALAAAWDPAEMDAVLLLAPLADTLGFDGPGDFFMAPDGRLTHRGEAAAAPFAYVGFQILKPQLVDPGPADEPFSIFPYWMRAAEAGRLRGVVLDGFWMHVGDPEARDAAEARLKEQG
jgi:MurNAc alpha-1-phosphate uridylyltransferase